MKIKIHRGTNQIGGCVTEYEHNGFKLFVDFGQELSGTKTTDTLEIEGLTKGDLSKSILLVTHYHGDHIGCISSIPEDVPIYMGKIGCEIQRALSRHLLSVNSVHKSIVAKLDNVDTFSALEIIQHGEFKVTPLTIDHSAFDAYAFKIEAGGISVFHTGDFRTHGFRGRSMHKMLEKFVGKVDYVVCEGTNVSREGVALLSERQLQRSFEKLFRDNKGCLVYVSTTNIDRVFSLYHAAQRVGRPFYVDRFQKEIMDIVVQSNHEWSKSKLYHYCKYKPLVLMYDKDGEFLVKEDFLDFLCAKGFVLLARSGSRFDNLITKLPGKKVKILSMWDGYVKEGTGAFNDALVASLVDGYIHMHTSGHCDMNSIRALFAILQPKGIIPIHTDNPDKFAQLFCDEWPIIRINDGESITTISNH